MNYRLASSFFLIVFSACAAIMVFRLSNVELRLKEVPLESPKRKSPNGNSRPGPTKPRIQRPDDVPKLDRLKFVITDYILITCGIISAIGTIICAVCAIRQERRSRL